MPTRSTPDRATLRRLLRARELAHDAYATPLRLDDLALAAGLSRAHFLRSFAVAFGVTPHEYLVRVRIEQARRVLARGGSVTAACHEVGFASLGSFSRTFAARIGASPRDWQRRARRVIGRPEFWPALWIPACYLARFTSSTFGEAVEPLPR